MKAFLLTMALFLTTQVSQALVQFEIQPLSLKPSAEVMGVHTGVRGQDAIILTGYAARKVAQDGHFGYDQDREMIVVTGCEVSDLISATLGGVYNIGKLAVITSAAFASAGLKLAFGAIYMGAKFALITVGAAATIGKTVVLATLKGLAYSAYWLADNGLHFIKVPFAAVGTFFGFLCEIPDYFGYDMLACNNAEPEPPAKGQK